MDLTDFDSARFLRDYWQKKPLLIRNPWAEWRNPLEPDELAGLACEADVEARLILRRRDGWMLERGPLEESRFAKLGKAPWTLLVQAVDHHVPDVAALIDPFRFVPNWRIDDVMVSYAVDGGGVGPHFDQYDVFLVQGLGKRRWRIGGPCDADTPLLPHDDLRLLADFEAVEEWVLEPGDILYVPPGVAHDGIAVGDDCMTYSIGFRAPSRSELIAHFCDDVLARLAEDDRYGDPDLAPQDNPGEISSAALARLQGMISDALLDRDAFARWFGGYTTTRKYPDVDWAPDEPVEGEEMRRELAKGEGLVRNPASRFSFVRQGDGTTLLFVDGESFPCAGAMAALAEQLCGSGRIVIDQDLLGSDEAMALLVTLFNEGSLAFDPDD
ncbi:cupin domain-containing protein [Sphingobium nicotianae]|uniref:Cupin domain-containing protein n=1 Tax=Sphingobium nicotianae TaxID=2782607 RepID=A0A9X1AIF1_9SPHN|nr:cupin domain-containing protein [Sphingobium nicotianae]MBT2185857.1 cupin domain-containing protein [Sphingobium nicotianae]